jgi:hypothetical protein
VATFKLYKCSIIVVMLTSRSVFNLMYLQDPGQYYISLESLLYHLSEYAWCDTNFLKQICHTWRVFIVTAWMHVSLQHRILYYTKVVTSKYYKCSLITVKIVWNSINFPGIPPAFNIDDECKKWEMYCYIFTFCDLYYAAILSYAFTWHQLLSSWHAYP